MISVLCPSRGRPQYARELLESMRATEAFPGNELILRLDDDDHTLDEYRRQLGGSDVRVVVGPRVVLSQCWNEAWAKARYDIGMLCGDDIRFRTQDWDLVVLNEFDKFPDKLVLVHGEDQIQGDRMSTHPWVHRRWVETVGYFVPPLFASDYNDAWLYEVANQVGRRRFLPHVVTEHLHPVAGKGQWDATHQERMERHRAENCDGLFAQTTEDRVRDAKKLQVVIDEEAAK